MDHLFEEDSFVINIAASAVRQDTKLDLRAKGEDYTRIAAAGFVPGQHYVLTDLDGTTSALGVLRPAQKPRRLASASLQMCKGTIESPYLELELPLSGLPSDALKFFAFLKGSGYTIYLKARVYPKSKIIRLYWPEGSEFKNARLTKRAK